MLRPVVSHGIAGWTETGSYLEPTLTADEGVTTVSPPGKPASELYRGFASIPLSVLAQGWTHIGDPDSAGGYIALMLALDDQWLGADRARIRSAVGLAGPYDFLPLTDPELKIIFGTEADLAKTQPITYVDGKAPPVLLVTGRLDRIVSPGNVTRLAARIRERGGQVETERYSLLGHITLIGSFAEPLRAMMPVVGDVTRFLEASGAGP